ncbi:MAG: hypothetical protein RL115_2166 [Bacteroidota bacterium]|jgi:uncharacterized protein YfiM (DUF2279 family)
MKPAAVLLSSSLASHYQSLLQLDTSAFRSLCSILFISLLISLKSTAQIIADTSLPSTEIICGDPLELTDAFKGGLGLANSSVSLQNFKLDSLSPKQIKSRTRLITGLNVIGYGGVMTALAAAWYKDYTKTKLHSFNDSREWLQVDKIGHYYGTWIESRANNEAWKWAGMERKKRIWISGLTSLAFQSTIEYLDGRSAEWGWSWSDFGANLLGSSTFIAQELAWDEQRIKLKWSFHKKNYKDASLNQRSDALFGKTTPERFLKDYNGQTYWATVDVKSFFPTSKWPKWLGVSLGYGAEGMFGGEENIAKDANGNFTFDRRDIARRRQWYLAPDIDLSKIKTKSKLVNFIFTIFSAFKFPTPSLEFSKGKLRVNAIHF